MYKKQWIYGWILTAPALAVLLIFTHIPAVKTLISSFFSTATRRRPSEFVGLENYELLLNDDVFWTALINNFWYAVATIPTTIALAIIMALWVNNNLKGQTFLRISFFAPTVLPLIAVANIWLFFYTPGFGLLDQIRMFFFDVPETNWLGQKTTVLPAIITVAIWKEAGFFMIFYLAALQAIPPTYKEAADIEGCSKWHFFWKITFPLLMPTTLFVMVNAVINSFRLVDHIFIMTGGGPDNSSSLLLYYIYEVAFKYWDTSYASTLTVVLLLIMFTIAIGQFLFLDRKVHYR
ncbi:carbohydrate ABC transporter permease [Thaumasiovibrio sp. DFM-14]|uniref:carbohydrate ABC transporter permease n=1 Tax=Thaumasiovibrio sp. DFM-14 TaxID=3384792 RepID=UPI0039A2B4B0